MLIGGPGGGLECNKMCGFCRSDQALGNLFSTPWKRGQKKVWYDRHALHCFFCCRFVVRALCRWAVMGRSAGV